MKIKTIKTIKTFSLTYLLVAAFIAVLAVQSDAAVITTSITIKKACISMPDGGVTAPVTPPTPPACPSGTIQMWLPHDGTKYLTPGSFKITAAEGDSLTITVRNELGIPVSLVIPGQTLSNMNNEGPVWFKDIDDPYGIDIVKGSRPTPTNAADPNDPAYKYRVRSFAHETPAGSTATSTPYTWNSLKEGTYLILSGTHPSLQVPMGIYGILVVQEAGGGPYAGIAAPDNDITLLFSEIDPAIHNAADDTKPQEFPSTNDYKPKYFLINGKPFPANDPILIGTAGQTTLLRFLNAGLDTYVPLLQGQSMQVIAEDAFLKPANLRFTRYSVDLHAGKTFDALITNPAAGYIPVYDRRLYLSNATQAPGGMLAYLEVTGAQQKLTVATNGGTGTGRVTVDTLPGGINCDSSIETSVPPAPPAIGATDCTQDYNTNTELKLVGHPNPGSILALASDGTPFVPDTKPPVPVAWTGCDEVTDANECLVTMDSAKDVTANFRAFSKLKLLTPNGGEIIPAGSAYLVQWGAPAKAATFRLRYSLDNGTTWLLIKKGITGNSFSWIVPTPGKNRKSALIQVTSFNKAGTSLESDQSNAVFTIETVTVNEPVKGAIWESGVPHTIEWVSGATPGLVKKIVIEYTKNNGVTWNLVEKIDNLDGSYDAGGSSSPWVIPAVSANKPDSFVRVTLKDAAGNIVARDKSGRFTITPPQSAP